MKAFAAVLAAASFLSTTVAIDPIVIKGSKFFYSNNGTQFFIRGIAYQQDYSGNGTTVAESGDTYIDPIADEASCTRDIPYLQQLGTNVIRVYAIDPTQNHDACMNALADAGIYVISDLSAPVTGESIVRSDPEWNDNLYARFTAVIDNMVKYNNTLGFFAGNEVTNNVTNTYASPFVKAAVRDMKQYIVDQKYRAIGVGYATSDDADVRVDVANYFDCGPRADTVDFWGYNIYSWCGNSSYTESGYDQRTAEFKNFNVPVFFAEYGCNKPQPRTFGDVPTLYGPLMSPVWSGGIVYEYFQGTNDFGLISLDGNSVSTLDVFNYLSSQLAQISPSGTNSADYTPTNTAAASCPTTNSDWVAATDLPPRPDRQLCECMYDALTCVPNNVDTNSIGDLFGLVCGLDSKACDGIAHNGTAPGTYGAYGMCNATEQLGWALNAYYLAQNSYNRQSACSFNGSATLKSATTPTGACSSLIAQAGSDGTGTLSSSGSGSGSGNAAVHFSTIPVLNTAIPVAIYMVVALVCGAGMILL